MSTIECKITGDIVLPCEDGDTVAVSRPGYDKPEEELFMSHVDCEVCGSGSIECKGAFVLTSEIDNKMCEPVGLCWKHLQDGYIDIVILSQPRYYVMLWQRIANSGIVSFDKTELKHVLKASYGGKFVKTTIIQGKVVKEFGVQG